MARISANEFAEKWQRRMKNAVEDMRQGIQRVNEAPTAKAAAKADKMLAKITEAVQSGVWSERLRKVGLEDWRQAILSKGLQRVASGVDGATDKVQDFAQQLLQHIDAGLNQIRQMPDMTIEDSVNRAAAWIRHMSKFKKK